MLKLIDNFLNKITMYRLVLYYLAALWGVALVFSVARILLFRPVDLIFSGAIILFSCWLVNFIFGKFFEAPVNVESVYITAAILALIISPISLSASSISEKIWFLVWASVWSIVSKFIIAVRKKHIFNPAAFGVALTAFTIGQSASWWIGTAVMTPFVLIGGLLVVRKISRWDLVVSFVIVAAATILSFAYLKNADLILSLKNIVFTAPLLFFALVMLTEPLTTPPSRNLQIAYGALVGFLFAPDIHIANIYFTPELALLAGNIFSYLASPKSKYLLTLRQKIQLAPNIFDFIFSSERRLQFAPGRYLEWTLGHSRPDSRGNRRYFTIASSPTEEEIHLGVKFYPQPSSFKRALYSLKPGDQIAAGQLAGDFVLPKDQKHKLVFIAGGIGVTPFRSMVKYLSDRNEARDIILLYSAGSEAELVYKDVFETAREKLGIKTIYQTSPITPELIKREITDWRQRTFYISGPHGMVAAFANMLKALGVKNKNIKTDFFPGFA